MKEYQALSVREFMLMNEGYQVRRAHELESARSVCYMIAATNRDPKKAFPAIQEFWPLITDTPVEVETGDEEYRYLKALIAKSKEQNFV